VKNIQQNNNANQKKEKERIVFVRRIPSRERCAESGWYAWDYLLSAPMDQAFIMRLKDLGGSFVFLHMLKKPFFKLESDYYALKGVLGDDFFRVATHEDNEVLLKRVENFINGADDHDHSEGHDEA